MWAPKVDADWLVLVIESGFCLVEPQRPNFIIVLINVSDKMEDRSTRDSDVKTSVSSFPQITFPDKLWITQGLLCYPDRMNPSNCWVNNCTRNMGHAGLDRAPYLLLWNICFVWNVENSNLWMTKVSKWKSNWNNLWSKVNFLVDDASSVLIFWESI